MFVWWCLMQQYFSYIVAASFIGGGNQRTRRKLFLFWWNFTQNPPSVLPLKLQLIWPNGFREDFFNKWSGKRKWLWAIAPPSSQHSMGHFSVVFVKTKIFYGPFNFCMGHLHRITKLYVSNGPWPLPFPITV